MGDRMWAKLLDGYCERAGDPAFWAEPLNAATNGAFIIAGAALIALLVRDARSGVRQGSALIGAQATVLSWLMAVLIVVIGVGSFLFHTTAYRWAAVADTTPIMIFMLTAVYVLTVRGFRAPRWGGVLAVIGFVALAVGFMQLGQLLRALLPIASLGGVLGYGPALVVLLVSGVVLSHSGSDARRDAGRRLAAAGAVFALSLTLRTLDKPYCGYWTYDGVQIGTHFLWHLLNALTLYLTASALIGLAAHAPRRLRGGAVRI